MKGSLMNPSGDTSQPSGPVLPVKAKSVITVQSPATAAQPAANPGSAWQYLGVLAAALATSGLLCLCYFPVAWAWPAWFALVPLLGLVRSQVRPSWVYLSAYLSGVAFFLPVLAWMPVADWRMSYAWVTLALYCAAYVPVGIWLLRVFDRRLGVPLTFSVPAVWVCLEWFRSFLLTGFAWYYLGHSQHDALPVIQVADLGGVYVVTFVVAMVNGLLAEWLYLCPPWRSLLRQREPALTVRGPVRPRLLQTLAVACVVAAALGYGAYRLGQDDFTPGPTVALLQGNIDQRLRNTAAAPVEGAEKARQKIIRSHLALCYAAVGKRLTTDVEGQVKVEGEGNPEPPDLIVWPESSFPMLWGDYDREALAPADPSAPAPENDIPADWRQWQTQMQRSVELLAGPGRTGCNTNLLLGVNTELWTGKDQKPRLHTSALLVRKPGAIGPRYDKIKRVPFGEYVPLRESLPFLNYFAPYDHDYSIARGEELTRFDLGKYRFGVLICYEDTDPFLARRYGAEDADGPPVDFLVNISNDGWFDGSSEHSEHLAIARFRAVETRKPLVRAVNMGISAVIDGNGRVLAPSNLTSYHYDGADFWNLPPKNVRPADLPLGEWSNYKKVQGVWTAAVPLDARSSLYSRWGDWFAVLCCAMIGIGLCYIIVARNRLPANAV